MSRATPLMLDVTTRLLACEANGSKSSGPDGLVAFKVCEKLQPHFATLLGKGGFRAILSRALAVAQSENPWIRGVEVKENGSLELLAKTAKHGDAERSWEGGVLLVAQLLGLLVAFSGENLTLRMVGEVWPKLELNNLQTIRDRHEKR